MQGRLGVLHLERFFPRTFGPEGQGEEVRFSGSRDVQSTHRAGARDTRLFGNLACDGPGPREEISHRGVFHFYLEQFNSGAIDRDFEFAQDFGNAVIAGYLGITRRALSENRPATSQETRKQLEYHTLYFLQVLTLDRGTTSGLLVHNQNDVGILGSLPSKIDRGSLQGWAGIHPPLQRALIHKLLD